MEILKKSIVIFVLSFSLFLLTGCVEYNPDYLKTEEGKHLPVEHCIRGTEGARLYGKLAQFEGKFLTFEKGAFGSIEMGHYLKDKKYDQITLVGLVSYICVLSNAVICKAALPNAHIIVEKDLTSAYDKHAQEIGFETLRNIHVEIK